MFLVESSPICNTIIFYILLIIMILIFKPDIMYCSKTNKFKSFGCGKNQTIFCFPIVCLSSVVLLYLLFLMIDVLYEYLDT